MSREKWAPKKLDELGFVGRGRSRHRPRNDPSLYGGSFPFFQTGDIKAAGLYLRNYSQTYNDNGLAQSKLWGPSTLCITIAANIAETAILDVEGCFPDSVVGFIADPNKCDVKFIKYFIDTIKVNMQSISQGTTQDNLSLGKLLNFDILTPPLPTQRKIAGILSAYDDLIENNTRRIALLEEMAQLIYREWFVHFRFPGHEGVKMVNSELGPIPEGWELVRFSDLLASFLGGDWGTDKSDDKHSLEVTVIRGTDFEDIQKGNELRAPTRYITKSSFEKRALLPGDILIENSVNANTRSVGTSLMISNDILQRIGRPAICASFCKNFRLVNKHLASLVFYHLRYLHSSQRMLFYQHIATNGIGNFQAKRFVTSEQLLLPEDSNFYGLFSNLYLLASTLASKNKLLRKARDLLLTRLISGQLDLSEMDIPNMEQSN